MRFSNYIQKLNLFTFSEKIVILLFSSATYIFEKINKNLVNSYLLFGDLKKEGVEINVEGDCNVFQYRINDRNYTFSLKRNSSDALVFKQLILEKEYQDVVDLFQNQKMGFEKMVDGGANIGLASIYFKAYFPNAEIIALEPVSDTFQRLKKNIFEKNNLKNVVCNQKGLWNTDTHLKVDKSNRDKADWSFRLIESPVADENTIETTSISSILIENTWDRVDFLKLDIEGGETDLFKDSETVKNWLPKVKVLAVEIHDEFNWRENIYELLKEFNFEYFESASLTIGINRSLTKL